ncbi:MAG: histidine kinase [Bacteroidetes bacterium]|nr:histidine kinase [Bacteroidota bacterium]
MRTLKKYSWRLVVALAVFVFFQITTASSVDEILNWQLEDEVFLYFTVGVVMIIWEISGRVINSFDRLILCRKFSVKRLFAAFWIDSFILLPFLIGAAYASTYVIKPMINCPVIDAESEFWKVTIQSVVIAWLVISFQLARLNFRYAQKAENEKTLIQKELLISKYESLKNQVNPHFLFNSFSVLSSLIHENQDLASEFLEQLSKMYRYMLDNKDNQMVSLQKEVDFMNSYIYLLKARHEDSINIDINLPIDQESFFVPTLSLQMLIENAIKHNKFSKDNPLTIRIFNDGEDYLVVENELKAKKQEMKSTKVGLENIRKRYDYQSERRVIISESESHFTVKLPILTSIQFT